MITYQTENDLSPLEFKELLVKSTLGERRPVDDMDRLTAMLQNANIIITARSGNQLVGVARSVSDMVYCTYLSDLAVDEAWQKQGIGKQLIRHTKLAAPQANLILLAAPKAVDYYPHIGMTRHDACYMLKDVEDLGL